MKLVKEGWSLVVMILALLFLPQENWKFWFSDRPEDWYGELHISGHSTDFLIIKNAGKDDVNLNIDGNLEIAAMSIGSRSGFIDPKSAKIPQESYSVVRLSSGQLAISPSERAFSSKGRTFRARRLYVSTEAEDDVSILLLFIGAFLVAVLAFSVGFWCYQGTSLLPDDS